MSSHDGICFVLPGERRSASGQGMEKAEGAFIQDVKHDMPIVNPSSSIPVSQELRLIPNTIFPQGPPHKLLPSTSATPPLPESRPILSPTTTLAQYGIKVRDFAYESTLPPVTPYTRAPQAPTGPRPLKRLRGDEEFFSVGDGSSNSHSVPTILSDVKPKPLERKVTEPVIDVPPLRARGFMGLAPLTFSKRPRLLEQTNESDTLPPSQSQPESQSSSQSQPSLQFTSQDSEPEPYIKTPLVTPNGSLQWPDTVIDTSSIPTSQLDTASQAQDAELISISHFGFDTEFSQMDDSSEGGTCPITERSPNPQPASLPHVSQTTNSPVLLNDRHLILPSRSSIALSSPPSSPRYFLRSRAITVSQSPTYSRSMSRRTKQLSRHQLSFSMRSAQSKKQKQKQKPTRKAGGAATIAG